MDSNRDLNQKIANLPPEVEFLLTPALHLRFLA